MTARRAAVVAELARARDLGFLGPGPVERHWDHAVAFTAAVPAPPGAVLDLGAGGGTPGLVLAVLWPNAQVTLLDAMARRTSFLTEAVARLGLGDRVRVVTERAEVSGRDPVERGRYDVVTARSFGPPAVTAECGAPFLRPGGVLLVAEPPVEETARWPAAALAPLGLVDDGMAGLPGASVRRLRLAGAVDDRYPRRVGIPAKRPLF